jgi:hypothetical protein
MNLQKSNTYYISERREYVLGVDIFLHLEFFLWIFWYFKTQFLNF